jgi:hypothetical protein
MGQIIDWLVEDEQKELFDIVWAAVVTVVFLALAALVCWALGRWPLAVRLARAYAVLWCVMHLSAALLLRLQRTFRVNLHDHPDAYVISGLVVGGLLQAGWSAFAALAARDSAAGAGLWVAALLYFGGALSCYVAFGVVSSFYMGHIYKFVNLPLGQAAFVLFCLWPAAARFLFGWFFAVFRL